MKEHEEYNIEDDKNIGQNNVNEMEQNNENIEQIEEKEGDIQMENNIQTEEKDENEEQNYKNSKFQIQKIEYAQLFSQENISRNEELYQINQE